MNAKRKVVDSKKMSIGHRKQNSGASICKVSVSEGTERRSLLAYFFSLNQLSVVQQTHYGR